MKALAFVSESAHSRQSVWQFDRVMSLLAYDYDLTVIFHNCGLSQMVENKAWRNLTLFGVNGVYYVIENDFIDESNFLIPAKRISAKEVSVLIQDADLVI